MPRSPCRVRLAAQPGSTGEGQASGQPLTPQVEGWFNRLPDALVALSRELLDKAIKLASTVSGHFSNDRLNDLAGSSETS